MAILEQENEFERGVKGGLLGGAAMFLAVEPFHWFGLTRYDILYIAGETVFTYQRTWETILLALFIHALISCFWGVCLAILINRCFNQRWLLIKYLVSGLMVFFFHLGVLDDVFHYDREIHKATLDMFIYMCGYVFYGYILYYYLHRRH